MHFTLLIMYISRSLRWNHNKRILNTYCETHTADKRGHIILYYNNAYPLQCTKRLYTSIYSLQRLIGIVIMVKWKDYTLRQLVILLYISACLV